MNKLQKLTASQVFAGLVMIFCCLSSQQAAATHPFHVSSAEVQWNPKTGNFEVALCVWPADLEKAIALQTGKPTDLDQVNDINELMSKYIASRFAISKLDDSKRHVPQRVRWVGHEMTLKNAWLYFEIGGKQGPGRWRVENRMFLELNDDQINHVQLDVGGPIQTFSLSRRKSFAEIDTNHPVSPISARGNPFGR